MTNASNEQQENKRELHAGTGFMANLTEAIRHYEEKGYTENIIAKNGFFSCRNNSIKIDSHDIHVDEMQRFENTSDPSDQSILYAISAPAHDVKGLFVESYGLYNDDLNEDMTQALRAHLNPANKANSKNAKL